jgi:hypothetical protein
MTNERRWAAGHCANRLWRLNNLYTITDKNGRRVLFTMNSAREALYRAMHRQNVILKARQRGFTTFIQLLMLDACVFNSDVRAGTIAHTLPNAQVIFRDKVRFPYDNLPDMIKNLAPARNDNACELLLANNSSIRVGVSLRSGTLQYLHVSEYGKICAKFPEKAREVRSGALNTVEQARHGVHREHRGRPGRTLLRAVPGRADAAQRRLRAHGDGLQVSFLALA